jgi:hypothetical protein
MSNLCVIDLDQVQEDFCYMVNHASHVPISSLYFLLIPMKSCPILSPSNVAFGSEADFWNKVLSVKSEKGLRGKERLRLRTKEERGKV